MTRDQFTFYRSYYEALATLPPKDFKAVVLAVCAYALDEETVSLSGIPQTVFTLIRPTLDSGRNKAKNRLNKRKQEENKPITNEEQTDNKTEQTRKEGEREKEGEMEVEVECEREYENDMLKILPPDGGNTKSAPVAASAVADVQTDFLNRINPTPSSVCLDELAGYAETLGPEVCKRAFDEALDARKTQWSYIRGILRAKEAAGVRCLADWNDLEKRRETETARQKPQPRKNQPTCVAESDMSAYVKAFAAKKRTEG